MAEYDELDAYSGETEHNMWVDFDNCGKTGSPDVYDNDEDLDNNENRWE